MDLGSLGPNKEIELKFEIPGHCKSNTATLNFSSFPGYFSKIRKITPKMANLAENIQLEDGNFWPKIAKYELKPFSWNQ